MLQIAHISDLHIGRDRSTNSAAARLASALAVSRVDWICCTGDITHRGRVEEGKAFARLFKPVAGRLTVIPGNHDRQADDVAAVMSRGAFWERRVLSGALRLLCIDSTQPMNATLIAAHGELELDVIEQVVAATAEREQGQSLLVLIHHHLVRAAPDDLLEVFSDVQGLPFAGCLRHGRRLAERLSRRVAAVLHGHKHKISVQHVDGLPIVNAGCTTGLGRYRVLTLDDNVVVGESWVPF